ncbi:MAG: DUF885 domain-containing protein, partial [Bdellovibrionales bacterium]|nr:DUF885 domain-containing protein [Bdellovibrionales bacterium]
MKNLILAFLTIVLFSACTSAQKDGWSGGEDSKKLKTIIDQYWEFKIQESPTFATYTGDHRFNDQLDRVSLDDHKRRYLYFQQLFSEINGLDEDRLSEGERVSRSILKREVGDAIEELRFRSYLMPITGRSGFHIDLPELRNQMPLKTRKDYENYVARLRAAPQQFTDYIGLMKEGIQSHLVPPQIVLKDYENAIEPHTSPDLQKNVFYKPFLQFPKNMSAADQEFLRAQGADAVLNSVVPSYQRLAEFMKTEYYPGLRSTVGTSELPDGKEYYEHRVKMYTTLDLTPKDVHEQGLKEVERIKAEMTAVIQKTPQKKMSFKEFLQFLRKSPQFYVKTPEQLMKETAWIMKQAEGQLPNLFGRLPRIPVGLKEIPDYIAPKTTTAYYDSPPGDGSRAGYYYVNTYNLPARPLYEIEPLTLHEAVPGHHLQLALQQEMEDLPKFRRFTYFTAFVEGWALYAERLGLEMGFYTDPYRDFGRLTYEMWRACRLVVDTGLHAFGWSRDKAIQFMAENTALSLHN